jgi:hypothetical protein
VDFNYPGFFILRRQEMQADNPPFKIPKSGSILIFFQEEGPAIFFNGDTDKKVTELVEFLTSIWSSWDSYPDEETIAFS